MDATATDPLVGQLLDGRYRIDAKVARGGMATVFEAFDTRLDRTVAVKVMHAGLAQDDAFVQRFKREAKSAARLQHPNVVAIFDQGEDQGRVYLVMELVAGRTLRALLRERGRLDADEALGVTEGLLTALAAAHDAGIVHRDVKPENVLITDSGQVKVADFGLARAIESTNHTVADGTLIGTVAYLAPEQVLTGAADPRTDLYSAGVVLFEMLTGVVPFTGDVPITVAYQHVNDDVPPPSTVQRGLPVLVDDLVVGATRRPPEQRFGDARTMLSVVRRVRSAVGDVAHHTTMVPLEDAPTTVLSLGRPAPAAAGAKSRRGPKPAPQPARAGQRRRRLPLILAVVAGLILGTAGAVGWWLGSGRYTEAPTFVQLTQAAAEARAEELDVELRIKEPSPFSETVPRGTVLDQDPDPGERWRTGSAITLVISRGPDRVVIPDVRGKTEGEARDLLEAQRLDVVLAPREFSREVDEGSVISQNPEPRTARDTRPGTAVTLVVSKGAEPTIVPDVVGKDRDEAEPVLREAGLVVKVTLVFDDDEPEGRVLRQDLPAESQAARGDTITITVSKGPDVVIVPNVFGMERSQAEAELKAAGLKVKFTRRGRGDTVFDQNPNAGTRVRRGSTVTCFLV